MSTAIIAESMLKYENFFLKYDFQIMWAWSEFDMSMKSRAWRKKRQFSLRYKFNSSMIFVARFSSPPKSIIFVHSFLPQYLA